MEKLTKQEAISLHRKMWNWLADETERTEKIVNEGDYFLATGTPYEDQPDHECYCCEYDAQQQKENRDKRCQYYPLDLFHQSSTISLFGKRCQYCPLDWKSEYNRWMCLYKKELGDGKGLFTRWQNAESVEEAVKLARKIANLRER